MTSVEGGPLRSARGRAAVGWSEFSTRYLLLEGMLRDRRVLEIGTFDPRSLLRLQDLGASRVIGCAPDAARFDRSRFPSRAIELFTMDPGRIDFGDGSFDVVLVVDLAQELSHNPRFTHEVRRVLSKDGFCLLAYPASGRSLADLVEDGPLPALSPSRLEESVREVFSGARFYVQVPFVGVAIEPEGRRADLGVSLEPSTDNTPSRPSHVLALAGRSLPELHDRTLVELPFLDFEAMAEAERARSAADHHRLMLALAEAKQQLRKREDSLKQIHERLPKLRSAFEAKLRALSSRPPLRPEVVTPTVLERPTDDGLPPAVREARLEPRLSALEHQLEVERRRREAAEGRIRELEAEADLLERQLKASLPEPSVREEQGDWASGEPGALTEVPFAATIIERAPDRGELSELYDQLRERELALSDAALALARLNAESEGYQRRIEALETYAERTQVPGASPVAAELEEAERRILLLERTASDQEQRIDALTGELESHREVRHALGGDVQDAEARLRFLGRKLEEERLERAELERRAEARVEALAEALNRSDQAREALRERLLTLEDEQAEVVARAIAEIGQRVRRDRDQEQANIESVRDRLYAAERELHERRSVAEDLQKRLEDREARLLKLTQSAGNLEAEKRALELAAGHLSRETETLKARVGELRQERDTLAATSQLLLVERDTAAKLARRALEAEQEARDAGNSAAAAEETIERLERELEAAETARSALEDRLIQVGEHAKRQQGETIELRAQLEPKERAQKEWQGRVAALDGRLADLQRTLQERTTERDRALATRAELEEMIREVSTTAGVAIREQALLIEESEARDRRAKEALSELGQVLSSRAAAEAKAVEATGQALMFQGQKALLEAERAEWSGTKAQLEGRLQGALAEMVRLEDELTGLMEQAPVVSTEELLEVKAALEDAIARRQSAEEALARTLTEAAQISNDLRDRDRETQSLAAQVERGERERLEIDRARRQAEEARRSAEAGRAHAVAEHRAASERLTRLGFDQQALEQALAAKDREHQALRAELETVQSQLAEQRTQAPDPGLQAELYERLSEIEELRLGLSLARENLASRDRELVLARAEVERLGDRAAELALKAAEAARQQGQAEQEERQAELERVEQASDVRTELLAERLAREDAEAELEVARSRLAEVRQELSVLRAVEALGRVSDPPIGRSAELLRLRTRLHELEAALAATEPSPAAVTAFVPIDEDQDSIEQARAYAAELEHAQLLAERDRLRDRVEALEEALHLQEATAIARSTAESELTERLARHEEQVQTLERELVSLRRSLLERQESLDEQRHHRSISEARIHKLEEELQLAERTFQIERLRADGAEGGAQQLEAALAQSETRTAALGAELQHQERQNEALEEELASAKDALLEAQQSLDRASQRLEVNESSAGALEMRLQDAEAKSGELESELEALRAEVVARDRSLATAQRAQQTVEAERARALAETADLRENLEVLRLEAERRTEDFGDFEVEKAQLASMLSGLEGKVQALESENQRLAAELSEARATAPPPEELRRLLSRAGELEVRAEKAERERERATAEAADKALSEAQALERASRAEERAARSEERLKKEAARAIDAEERARHGEILSREVDTRARDLESKRRTLEARALEAEGKAEHAERMVKQAEAQVKQLEARLRSLGEETSRRTEVAEQRAQVAEQILARTRSESSARLGDLETKLTTLEEVAEAREAQRAELERTKTELDQLRAKLRQVEGTGATGEDTLALRGRCRSLEQMVSQRDGELKRLTALSEKVARELDEARAEVGRKLAEIRQNREGLDFVRRQLTQARTEAEGLRAKLELSGDAAELKAQLESKDQELARIRAEGLATESERHRLRSLIQSSEQSQVQHERRIAELETAIAERNQRLELLKRELADKAERLRRLSGLNE